MEPALKKRVENKKVGIPKGAQDLKDAIENIREIQKSKTAGDIAFVMKGLKNHFLFFNLSDDQLEHIVMNQMFYCEIEAKKPVFQQGENANSFFIFEKGKLEVIINNEVKRQLNPGEGFGELALMYNAPRSATIMAQERSYCWGIDRLTFRTAVEQMVTKDFEDNRKFIEKVNFFQNLTEHQKDAIASVLILQKFSDKFAIVNEGDPGSSFYIIKSGTVVVEKDGKEVRKLSPGESFGEQALYFNTLRQMTIRSSGESVCLALGRDDLARVLGDKIESVAYRNMQKWALEKSKWFSSLTLIQTEKVIDVMKTEKLKKGEILLNKGAKGNSKIIIVLEGSVATKAGTAMVAKGGIWGEIYQTDKHISDVLQEDLMMGEDGVISWLSSEQFVACIGGKLEEVLKKNEKSHERKMMDIESEQKKIGQSIELKNLIFIKKLGFGQFGSVFLVKEKSDDQLYALKSVSKQQIIQQQLEKHLIQEKMVLDLVQFPFIMQFIRTYKDEHSIYFLCEFIKGMELFDVIRQIGLLSTYDSQYYIGSLILATEYLHRNNIVYRDIKPENIMVDHKGIMKMIDMGTAKILKGNKGAVNRTFTIIGTPHYMAPEVINGKGYNFLVDLWSIGIVLYEFMCGGVPFGEEAEDPYEIYEEIIKKPIAYPNFLKDNKAKKFMEQLLAKIPEIRLGGSYAALKANPWFSDFDWDKLMDKELKPPYIPPKDKIISEKEITLMNSKAKSVTEEILIDQKNNKPQSNKQAVPKDPNWDKDF